MYMTEWISEYVNSKLEKKKEKHHYAYFLLTNKKHEIAVGENSFIENKTCTTIHAELDALSKINTWRECPKKIDLIVIKINKNGEIGEAKPCGHCIKVLDDSKLKIKNVYYSSNINNKYCIVKEKFSKMKNYDKNDKIIMSKAFRYNCNNKIYYENKK